MIKSDNQPKKTAKPKIVSKITVIKIDPWTHIKILQRGEKVVVRQGNDVLFNNLNNKVDFDKWWEETVDSLEKNVELEVIKSEIVDNAAMKKILAKYK